MSDWATGFDVSWYQRHLNMADAYNAGMSFVFIRASQGTAFDLAFGAHYRAAGGLLLRGAYHALLPDVNGQAMTFYRALLAANAFLDMELPPVLDVEKANLTGAKVQRFLEAFERLWAVKPMIYTSRTKWEHLVGQDAGWAAEYPLWVAHWGAEDPALPAPWAEWAFWQVGMQPVTFWHKRLDVNVFQGDRHRLRAFARGRHD